VNRRRTTRRMGWVEEVQDVERAGMVASPSTVMQIPRMLLGGWDVEKGGRGGDWLFSSRLLLPSCGGCWWCWLGCLWLGERRCHSLEAPNCQKR
jgi:hypothetical protein